MSVPACHDGAMQADGDLTYPARLQGLSLELAKGAGYLPGAWHVMVESRVVGVGDADFSLAAQRVHTWQMHRDAGLSVAASGDVAVGVEVRLGIGIPPLAVVAECRVVAVTDKPREYGFAYGTLPRHPERGEEAFMVRWLDDDAVVGTVAAFSQAASWYARRGGPATRWVQGLAARRYLAAISLVTPT